MISHEKFEEQLDPIFNRIFLSDKKTDRGNDWNGPMWQKNKAE